MTETDWEAYGIPAYNPLDEEAIYNRLAAQFVTLKAQEEIRANQYLSFDRPQIVIVFLGDLHLGAPGTDYEYIRRVIDLILRTPGMYLITVGDLIDNFILDKLRKARDNSNVAIIEEWALVRYIIRRIASKLPMVVGGNHDNWGIGLTGMDWMREVIASITPGVIYDSDDSRVDLRVGGVSFPGRLRHQWSGKSIYNAMHGIMRAGMLDQDFKWGVGGHTHKSGLYATFDLGGETRLAVQVGAAKRIDRHAIRGGFPKPNEEIAVAVLFDATTGKMTPYTDLQLAADTLTMRLNQGSDGETVVDKDLVDVGVHQLQCPV